MRLPALSSAADLLTWAGQLVKRWDSDFEALKPKLGQLTLTPSATTTTFSHFSLAPTRKIFLMPTTASAITAFAGLRVSTPTQGQVVITHPSSAATDQIFDYVILGV